MFQKQASKFAFYNNTFKGNNFLQNLSYRIHLKKNLPPFFLQTLFSRNDTRSLLLF